MMPIGETVTRDHFAERTNEIQTLVDRIRKRPVGRRAPQHIEPSSLGECDRLFYYRAKGVPTDVDLDSYGEFKRARAILGNAFEEMILGWFSDAGLLVAKQVPYKNAEFGISGRADAIVQFGGKNTILEIKSANINNFAYGVKNPKDGHLLQITSYLWMGGFPYGGYLAYATQNERGKILWKLVHVPLDPVRISEIQRIAERRRFALDMEILPDRPTETPIQYWQCNFDSDGVPYCPMRRTCWKGTRWEIPPPRDSPISEETR